MSRKNAISERAVKHFRDGYNCSQSVLLTMAEHWGDKNKLVPKIATAFGGGIGQCGSVCGALTGGVMAIGVKYGSNEPSAEKRARAYELARKLYLEFAKQNGSVACRDLIGYDLTNPAERQKVSEEKVSEKKCTSFVRSSVEILLSLTENKS
jgi:C_GCAxxG_C_C family probable redox protein